MAEALATKTVEKGDVFTVAEVAGIMAAKRTVRCDVRKRLPYKLYI